MGYPLGRNLGPITGVPPRKDMEPAEALWDGDVVLPRKDMGPVKSGSIMGWRWVHPRKGHGPVEVLWDGGGVSSEQTHTCENITSVILRMRTVIIEFS